ncbi:MAG: Sua5/YciO/YrdC/YwlC family protein [Halothiobacillaceae bacterium]|nr:Sua5/YciO/YrdC/YwlC family protein [Halothiobacillaceae bacterium]
MPVTSPRVAPIPAWQLRRAARWLRAGGVLAYPTEAVFGLGCDPRNDAALRRLLALKQRTWRKGLILIADDAAQLAGYLQPLPESVQMRAQASWPGATTWLWPARAQVSLWLRGAHPSLAVRIPAHPAARALCRAFGHALVSTSANRAGQHPARNALEVRRKLGAHAPVLIVHGEVNRRARPSQIIDLLSGQAVRS